jgi:hypothetical protein
VVYRDGEVNRDGSRQLCHVNPQFGQRVGLLPASRASRPMGKAQIATMIAHTGKLP